MNNIKIIKADKLHIPKMAELITQNLGTCNLIKGANNDVTARNIAELTDTIDYYQVAVDEKGRLLVYAASAMSKKTMIMALTWASIVMFYMLSSAKTTKDKESAQYCYRVALKTFTIILWFTRHGAK